LLTLTTSLALSRLPLSARSQPFVPCESDRPGSQTHRTLYIPPDYFEGSDDETRAARALCCVYTHVEVDDDCERPWMENYIGWQWMDERSTALRVMADAMDDICDMQMGAQDCANRKECVDDAMDNGGANLTPTLPPTTARPTIPPPTPPPTPRPSKAGKLFKGGKAKTVKRTRSDPFG